LSSQKRGWLAHVNQPSGPRVGKYRVNLQDLENVGATAIVDAVEKCAVVAIDEVGPMELYSEKFKEAVNVALESDKAVIAVVHWKADDKLINDVKARADAETFTVTNENRETIAQTITERI
jgi:nucleoside-triphosphatase